MRRSRRRSRCQCVVGAHRRPRPARSPRRRRDGRRSSIWSGSGRRPGCGSTAAACIPDTLGLTVATFRQTTSRADDPQVHTHAVISAKVQTDDGRWLALDARYLKRHQRMLGGLYQSVLRAELTHRYGVAWEPIVNGQAEIAGVPGELLEVFSEARRPGRRRAGGQGRRVPSPRGSGPDDAGSGPRCAGRRRPTPGPTRPATVSRICGHGGRPKPPSSAGRRAGSSPPIDGRRDAAGEPAPTVTVERGDRSALRVGFDVDPGRCAASDLRSPAARVRRCRDTAGRPPSSGPATR